MAEQLGTGTHLSDDAWAALAEHFDEAELVELVMTAAFYACVSRVLGGLEVPPEG
jgi:alkylhydroperoxidase family enzyme